MKKLLTCLGLLMALGVASGCTLYFGPDDDDGYYGDGSGDGSGWSCYSDYDCASGCYCSSGYYGDQSYGYGECVEAGYCTSDSECGYGLTCDEARNSCVPSDVPPPPPPPGCMSDDECAAGCYCDEATGTCQETSYCATDAECAATGMVCDEDRQTCVPEDPTPPPPPPACNEVTDEQTCVDRDDCVAIYAQFCHDTNGNACTAGSTSCVCDGNFFFARCEPASP